MKVIKPKWKWTISVAHAFVLIAISTFWINTNFTYGDERLLVQWTSIFKRVVLKIDEDPPKKDYLFINLAYDKALIAREEGLGKEVITDRQLLADFFRILKKHQDSVKYTICDVLLAGKSEQDSLLQAVVTGIRRIVFPVQMKSNHAIDSLTINVPSAIADYVIVKEGFLKFKLIQNDSIPTLPIFMYQEYSGHQIQKHYGWYTDGLRPMMNSLIIDYQIRTHELKEENEYPMINLAELLQLPEDIIAKEFLNGRIVVMGDFDHDVHETIYGETPGTLILLNVFLTLMDGKHLISIWWLLFLLICYTLFSRLLLFPDLIDNDSKYYNWIGPLLKTATYLAVLSIVSYLLFDKHIQVLVLTLYMNALLFIIQIKKKNLSWKHLKEWFLHLRETYFNIK